MNDGWLCDSILKTAARPSPMSTAPAFSPGPCSTCGPVGRQRLQVHARALVAAVLGPHHREDAELGEVRLAAHEARRCGRIRRGLRPWRSSTCRIDHAARDQRCRPDATATTDSKMHEAVGAAERGSHARSGCGIRPTTLRASLQRPAMLSTDPFGFAASVDRAAARRVAEDDLPVRFELREHVRRREVVAFAVRDRHPQHLARRGRGRERRVGLLDADVHVLAVELQARGCAASRRAAARPRAESGSRCRCRAPARRASANACTARMIGEKRAIAPVRR